MPAHRVPPFAMVNPKPGPPPVSVKRTIGAHRGPAGANQGHVQSPDSGFRPGDLGCGERWGGTATRSNDEKVPSLTYTSSGVLNVSWDWSHLFQIFWGADDAIRH